MGERQPNFIYIGPSKAGSTWLHEVLIRHPQIFLTDAKDLYFFDRYYDRGLDWYLSHFKDAGPEHRLVGEICQEYLSSPEAARRIRDCLGPDVKLMVTVREPAARAFSGYLYMRKHGVFEGSFREALETRPGMLNHSRYASLLSNYIAAFGRQAIYCGVFDDLQEDPQRFVKQLLSWLGVEPMALGESELAARLPASRARSVSLARVVKHGSNWARQHNASRLIGRVKRSPAVQRALYTPLKSDKPRLTDEDAQWVRERLTSEIVELEAMFDLDLRGRWGWA
jgi:hypothetical protein